MILSTCPRCSESLRVPEIDLPDDAYARCPWCSETFPASEITDHLPPMIHLLDAQGQPLSVSAAPVAAGLMETAEANPFAGAVDSHEDAAEEAAPALADSWGGESDALAETADEDSFDQFNLDAGSQANGAVDIQVAAPERAIESERPMRVRAKPSSKKKASPVKTLIGIALGPVLALPLAGAILLALGRAPNLGFWPFDGSYNKTQQRTAAPPLDSNSAKGPPSFRTQRPRKLTSGGSLLDDSSDVAKAVQEITGDSALATDTQPAGEMTDRSQRPITLPEPAIDDVAAGPDASPLSDRIAKVLGDDDTLDNLLADNDPAMANAGQPEELLPPEGIAVYPGDTQSVSTPDLAMAEDDDVKTELELKPSTIAIVDPAADEKPGQDVAPGELEPIEPAPIEPEPSQSETTELTPPEFTVPALPMERTPIDSPELTASIKEAAAAINELQNKREQSEATPRDLAMAYVTISAVGMHDADPASQQLSEFLNEVSASPLLEDLSIAGPQWWNYSTRPNDGILLIGAAQSDGDGTSITLTGKNRTAVVPVVLPPDTQLPESERVIAVGLITDSGDSPAVQLKAIQALP